MLRCAMTNEYTNEPVSTQRGIIYDKNYILNYLKTSDRDPIDGDLLRESDLIEIKLFPDDVEPLALKDSKFNSHIKAMNTEWLILKEEILNNKKQLSECKKKLSEVLYETEVYRNLIAKHLTEREK